MTNSTALPKAGQANAYPEVKKQIESHKQIAAHLETASKLHLETAKHYEQGDKDKAAKSAIVANDSCELALKAQKEIKK